MRHQKRFTSVSWIPSEAVPGISKALFRTGLAHYDTPPPDHLPSDEAIKELGKQDGFRFVNRMSVWIESDGNKIVDFGYSTDSDVVMGSTTVRLGPISLTLPAPSMPAIQQTKPSENVVVFTQTAGGRTAFPAPRRVNKGIRLRAPIVWTTLQVELSADGSTATSLLGASPFPRHWLYNHDGELTAKVGQANYRRWFHRTSLKRSPWRGSEIEQKVTEAEAPIERAIASEVMHGGSKPVITEFKEGSTIIEQGDVGYEVFLVLDGIVGIIVNGRELVELGPGSIVGERSQFEGGIRTATVLAKTPTRVAISSPDFLDLTRLNELQELHHREDSAVGDLD